MNENPEGTPNPFSPNQNAASSGTPMDTTPPTQAPALTEPVSQTPINPVVETPTEATPASTTTVSSLDPTGRNMEQPAIPTSEIPKTKKTGLIVGIIIGAIALIVGIIAAIIILMSLNKGDPVTAAMKKLMNGNSYKNIAIDGDINVEINTSLSPIKTASINLDSEAVVGSMANSSRAKLTITDQSNNDYSVTLEEVYADNGNLYLKAEGIDTLINDDNFLNLIMGNNSAGDFNITPTTIPPQLEPVFTIVKAIDDIWLKVSAEEIKAATGSIGQTDASNSLNCLANLAKDTNKNSNSAIEIYSRYPFIISSNKDILIASRQNPVYKINFDAKNLTEFLNAMGATDLGQSVSSCLGTKSITNITESDIQEVIDVMPQFYVEVNNDNDFTRLYFESDVSNGMATATVDLNFNYPANVNIVEPQKSTDLQTVIQALVNNINNN